MTAEARDVLLKLIDRDDVYGLMLAAVGLWSDRYHPRAGYVAVVAEEGDRTPAVQIPVTPTSSLSS